MSRRLPLATLCFCCGGLGVWLWTGPAAADDTGAKAAAPASAATAAAETTPGTAATATATAAPQSAPSEPVPQTVRLVYKFKAGDRLDYEVVSDMQITSRYDEATEVATNRTESRKHLAVKEVDASGAAELELVLDWVRMHVNFGPDDPGVVMDSKQPASWPKQYQYVLAAVGNPQARIKISPSGKLLKGPEAGPAAATATAAADKSADAQQTPLVVFPEEAIAVGHTWTEKYEVRVTVPGNLTQGINMLRTFRLESVEGPLATISMKTAVLTPIHNPKIAAQLIQREVSGKIVFDIEQGRIVSRNTDADKDVPTPFGPKTWMRAVSHYVEKMIPTPPAADVATKNAPTETK
jgi:hypothetical protein